MKVTLQLATSIDGFIARRDGSFDWCFTDQDYGMAEFAPSVTIFMRSASASPAKNVTLA